MELNNLATEDAVDELLPYVADEKIQVQSSRWSARPILAGLCVFAMVIVVITYKQRVDLGTIDAEGLQELAESKPWKEGEGKPKKYYFKADHRGTVVPIVRCISVPRWFCDKRKYDYFPCAAPSSKSWSTSSAGSADTRMDACDSNQVCAGVAGYNDGHAMKKVYTIALALHKLGEKKDWATCLKKRIHCGDGYTEYLWGRPSWCHATYSPVPLLTGGHLMQEHTEQQVKKLCDADPGCTGYTHMTDSAVIYLVNNHATRTQNGYAMAYDKWWKSCMKHVGLHKNWHQWCW